MKRLQTIIIALLLPMSMSGSAAEKPKGPDMSTPERTLFTFLEASRVGEVDTYLGALSQDSRKVLVEGAEQFGENLQELIKEDPFASFELTGSVQTEEKAAIQITAHYKESWFMMDGMNVTALSEDDRTALAEPAIHSNNVVYHMPCAVKGVGFVVYLFVKEGRAWKIKKGLGYPVKLDLQKFMEE